MMFLLNEDYNELLEEDSLYKTKKVYVLLTYTHTAYAKLTKFMLDHPYTHCSLALDKQLEQLYSFTVSPSGFIRENIKESKVLRESSYSLYSITVTHEQYLQIKERMEYLINHQGDTKYNIWGPLKLLISKPSKSRSDILFCSEFVAETLAIADDKLFRKSASLVAPYDFAKNKKFKFEGRGILKNYNPQKIKDV